MLLVTAGAQVPLERCESACAAPLAPTIAPLVRGGYTPDDPRLPAIQGAVTVPAFAPSAAELDVYVQGPGRAALVAYGAGVLVSAQHTMPYVQAGRTPQRALGWYVTLGHAKLHRYDEFLIGTDKSRKPVPGVRQPPRYWSPAVTVRLPERRVRTDVYVAGMFGSYLADSEGAGPAERRPLRGLTIGATIAADARAVGGVFGGPFGSRTQPGHTPHAPPPSPHATPP